MRGFDGRCWFGTAMHSTLATSGKSSPNCVRRFPMRVRIRERRLVLIALLASMWLPISSGCAKKETAPLRSSVGTSAAVELPDVGAPMLTKAVAARIQSGMAQGDALAVLQE